MTAEQLRKRWQTESGQSSLKVIKKAFKSGRLPRTDLILPERIENRADFRGIALPQAKIFEIAFSGADFSYADLSDAWIEHCVFHDAIFLKTNLSRVADHGNRFEEARFVGSDFREAALGYEGSKYTKCDFEKCKFNGAVFIRAEFEECVFKDCELTSVDFNVSSFVRCKFIGKLEDVRFRGDYAFTKDRDRFGPHKNPKMDRVDFSEASLSWLSVTDGASLGTIVLPDDPYIFRLDNLDRVLPFAKEQVRRRFSGHDLEAAELFFHVRLQYASSQKESIINLHDYAKPPVSKTFIRELKELLLEAHEQLTKGKGNQ